VGRGLRPDSPDRHARHGGLLGGAQWGGRRALPGAGPAPPTGRDARTSGRARRGGGVRRLAGAGLGARAPVLLALSHGAEHRAGGARACQVELWKRWEMAS
jgi:hypothetical protein